MMQLNIFIWTPTVCVYCICFQCSFCKITELSLWWRLLWNTACVTAQDVRRIPSSQPSHTEYKDLFVAEQALQKTPKPRVLAGTIINWFCQRGNNSLWLAQAWKKWVGFGWPPCRPIGRVEGDWPPCVIINQGGGAEGLFVSSYWLDLNGTASSRWQGWDGRSLGAIRRYINWQRLSMLGHCACDNL